MNFFVPRKVLHCNRSENGGKAAQSKGSGCESHLCLWGELDVVMKSLFKQGYGVTPRRGV